MTIPYIYSGVNYHTREVDESINVALIRKLIPSIISCTDNLAEYNFAILSTFNEVVEIPLISPLYSHSNAHTQLLLCFLK